MKKRGIAVWLASGIAAFGLLLLAGFAQERGTAIEWVGFIALVAGLLCGLYFVAAPLLWIYDELWHLRYRWRRRRQVRAESRKAAQLDDARKPLPRPKTRALQRPRPHPLAAQGSSRSKRRE